MVAAHVCLQLLYVIAFIVGMALAVGFVGAVIITINEYKEIKKFSLNPDWDSTRDFIDALPVKERKRK